MRVLGTRLAITVALVAFCGNAAYAVISAQKDSADFANQSNGDQIWDGTAYVGDWDGATASGGTTADYSLNGSNLAINQTTNNGWLQQDSGTSAWESLGPDDSWTAEMRVHVLSAPGGVSLWGAQTGPGAGIITVNDNGVTPGAGVGLGLSTADNTDGFHTFRLAYDSSEGDYSVWRDGLLLTDSQGATLNTGLSRLIVGDCCSSYGGDGNVFEVEYVRYDVTGAFAPVPEPTTLAVVGLALAGVLAVRRRS